MKNILIVTIGLFLCGAVNAQQISHSTPIQELQHIWNPAFTAPGTKLDASVYFRKQWVGFEGSPTTAVTSGSGFTVTAVSYTHLTLPTIYSV